MAKVLMHSLLFSPDATANSYIFSDIASQLQINNHEVSVITTTPHYGVLKENLEKQPLMPGKKKWYKASDFHGIKCFHIVVPSEKGGMMQRLTTFLKFHYFALKLLKVEHINADVVLTQSPPLTIGIVNGLIARKLKAKGIYVVQDLFPDGPIVQGKIKNPLLIFVLRKLERSVYKLNDCVVAISEGIRNNLLNRVPQKTELAIIPNFVDTDIYRPMKKNEVEVAGCNFGNKFVVSYVGNIGNAHDLTPIFECAKAMENENTEFIIAGNGIKEEYYRGLAKKMNLSNVHFLGYVQRDETVKINAMSDVCLVMLAEHVKGTSFPSKTYTIMGSGKPVLICCSKGCDAMEYVNKNEIGWSVPCGDIDGFIRLMREIRNEPEEIKSRGEKAYKLVMKENTKEAVGSAYSALINRLIKK